MNDKKISVEKFDVEDLVREALLIPDGWKKEIYVDDDGVSFSEPMTQNSYTGKTPYEPIDGYVGDLESLAIDDFEGMHLRKDGTVEIVDDGSGVRGEYYDEVEIVDYDEAVDIIADIMWNDDDDYYEILEKIREKTGGK